MAQDRIAGAIAYAAQGATLRQYLACVDLLLDLARPGRDWLALGGFCIVGLVPSLKPLFVAVCRAVAPRCRRAGIRRVHILGVCAWDALAAAAAIFAGECIEVSTDSSSIEMNSIMGRTWREEHMTRRRGASPWRQMYTKSEKCAPGGYHPAALSLENIRRFAAWLERAEHVPHAIPGFQDALNVSAPPPMRVDCWQSDGVAVAFEVSFFAELDEVLAAAAELTDAPIVELQTDRWVWLNEWGTRTRTWGEAERESHG
ncbi:hypothetical protein OV079_00210 [Nannocystis pusilla]|uniref:Uncharacterized protein n=1 Tax=Nannocystis pusilla TaxID=889268 RepID=A0A9X3IUM4_9BACT|nr:hypothetical protein [Nannocystis pusilla]MCY1004015.1 hypothetical protein [Nannocystis pusilla]